MLKKFMFSIIFIVSIFPSFIFASSSPVVKVGDDYYDNLKDAIENAGSNDTIVLISNVELNDSLTIDKVINIDLNGNDISAPTKVFLVDGGTLNISGKGTIKESKPNYGVIMINGSTNSNDNDYSLVNIGKDVTLEGWSGIFINHKDSKAYGIEVNIDGKINAISDIEGGKGIGVYVNGNIKHVKNPPVVNILDNAKITSNGNGLYIAGYAIFNIGKSYISGLESGIGIKSGVLNIDGAKVESSGKDSTPTKGYNNGINASGVAIQIESNSGYAGNMEINISQGNFKSKNSNVLYEYIGKGANTEVKSISVSGGTFISEASKDVLVLSNEFKNLHSGFISGGKYSSNPNEYLKSGYSTNLDNGLYNVIASTVKQVSGFGSDVASNSTIKNIITFAIIAIIAIFIYLNRTKISNLIKKI